MGSWYYRIKGRIVATYLLWGIYKKKVLLLESSSISQGRVNSSSNRLDLYDSSRHGKALLGMGLLFYWSHCAWHHSQSHQKMTTHDAYHKMPTCLSLCGIWLDSTVSVKLKDKPWNVKTMVSSGGRNMLSNAQNKLKIEARQVGVGGEQRRKQVEKRFFKKWEEGSPWE